MVTSHDACFKLFSRYLMSMLVISSYFANKKISYFDFLIKKMSLANRVCTYLDLLRTIEVFVSVAICHLFSPAIHESNTKTCKDKKQLLELRVG
jgi:hypothetical protein